MALVGDGSGAVALLVEGQLVTRIDVGPLDAVWTAAFPTSPFAGIVSQPLENWRSVRVVAIAPTLKEERSLWRAATSS